jgi:hypothetical protein
MNTTVHPYPGVNGTLDANNEQNGVVHICDHEKPVLTIAVNYRHSDTLIPKELLRELLRRSGKTPDRGGLQQTPGAGHPILERTTQRLW